MVSATTTTLGSLLLATTILLVASRLVASLATSVALLLVASLTTLVATSLVISAVAAALVTTTTVATTLHIFFQFRKLCGSLNLEVDLAGSLVIKYVLKSLNVVGLDVEHCASVVFEAAHPLDVLTNIIGQILPQDIPDQANRIEWLIHGHLKSNAVFLSIQQRSLRHLLFMMARKQCQALAKGLLDITGVFFDQKIGGLSK